VLCFEKAAGSPADWSYRPDEVVCFRWSLVSESLMSQGSGVGQHGRGFAGMDGSVLLLLREDIFLVFL